MRPIIARLAGAVAATLLTLAIAGGVAYAGGPQDPASDSVPVDPGYGDGASQSVPEDPGYPD